MKRRKDKDERTKYMKTNLLISKKGTYLSVAGEGISVTFLFVCSYVFFFVSSGGDFNKGCCFAFFFAAETTTERDSGISSLFGFKGENRFRLLAPKKRRKEEKDERRKKRYRQCTRQCTLSRSSVSQSVSQ